MTNQREGQTNGNDKPTGMTNQREGQTNGNGKRKRSKDRKPTKCCQAHKCILFSASARFLKFQLPRCVHTIDFGSLGNVLGKRIRYGMLDVFQGLLFPGFAEVEEEERVVNFHELGCLLD